MTALISVFKYYLSLEAGIHAFVLYLEAKRIDLIQLYVQKQLLSQLFRKYNLT